MARFSFDGNYFATGGEDGVVRIWEVGEWIHNASEGHRGSVPPGQLFNSQVMREYVKHTKDVLDLSWCTRVLSRVFDS